MFGGNVAGISDLHDIEASKSGKFRSVFRKKFVPQTKIFWASFALQTCHPKTVCFFGLQSCTWGRASDCGKKTIQILKAPAIFGFVHMNRLQQEE